MSDNIFILEESSSDESETSSEEEIEELKDLNQEFLNQTKVEDYLKNHKYLITRDIERRTGDKNIYKEYFPSTNATLITPWSNRFKKEHIQYLYINGKPINEIEAYTLSQDYFWMMGDNRDNSEDSRFWGFVPKSHILGQPIITWFSINLDNYIPRLNRIGKIPN